MTNPDVLKQRWDKGAKILGVLVVSFLAAPIVHTVLVGLVGLVTTVFISACAVALTPVVSLWIANMRLYLYKKVASLNPVETLQNDYNERAKALDGYREMIAEKLTTAKNFGDTVDAYKKSRPELYTKYKAELDKMYQVIDSNKRQYSESLAKLEDYRQVVAFAQDEWKIAQAAAKANQKIGTANGQEFLQRIASETALDTIKTALNKSFADLDLAVADDDAARRMTNVTQTGTTNLLVTGNGGQRSLPPADDEDDVLSRRIPTFDVQAVPVQAEQDAPVSARRRSR